MQPLEPRYDAHKSFYGKAQVLVNPEQATGDEFTKTLLSYNTPVAAIVADGTARVFGIYSDTTLRHIKEFLKQNGFKAESKRQIKADYMEDK